MKHLIFFIATFLSSYSFSEVVEINTMREIIPHLRSKTLVVFDIDNTLASPPQMLGSDQWFGWMVKSLESRGLSETKARTKALVYWSQVQMKTPLLPVETLTPELINKLQSQRYPVIALTARPTSLAHRTIHQLKAIDIDLSRSSPWPSGTQVRADDRNGLSHGIMFAGFNNKGEVLARMLMQLEEKPEQVLFIDDKRHHAQNVSEYAERLGIKITSFRYGAADKAVKRFNPQVANIQAKYFNEILSDQMALKLSKR